jgi:acylphosphatase
VERRAFVVEGRVQGVGFRWWVRQRARELGVGGMVRNQEDGTVLVEATGTPRQLDELAAALREGPPGSVVARVRDSEATRDHEGPFGIER